MKKTKTKPDTLEAALEYARRRLPDGWTIETWDFQDFPKTRIRLGNGTRIIVVDIHKVEQFTNPLAAPTAIRRAVRLARKEAGL